jgi:hypothetical protein
MIRLAVSGPNQVRFDRDVNLVLGRTLLRHPSVYQAVNGERRPIAARFRKRHSHEVEFEIARYDRARPLVIDPVLAYPSLLGAGSPTDATSIYGVASDSAGNAYVTGFTPATDFPARNALQPNYGGDNADAFVAKISADGSTLLYSTFLGGNNTDQGNSIAVDSTDAVW